MVCIICSSLSVLYYEVACFEQKHMCTSLCVDTTVTNACSKMKQPVQYSWLRKARWILVVVFVRYVANRLVWCSDGVLWCVKCTCMPVTHHFVPCMGLLCCVCTSVIYRNLPSKRPWALEIHGPKHGGGRLHREAICTYNAYTHRP